MMRGRPIPIALVAATIAAATASSAGAQPRPSGLRGADPVIRQFQDWLLVCDNVRVCRAQPNGPSGSLMVRRDAGPDGALVLILDGQEPSEGFVPEPGSVRIDGASFAGLRWRLDRQGESASLGGDAALRFIRGIADASVLTYRAGEETLEVSLRGMKAALLAMDEAQGRLETPTAFTRPGRRPLTQVPRAPALPVVTAQPAPSAPPLPAAFAARVRRASGQILAANECSPERADIDQAYALTASEAIAFLFCGQGSVSTSYVIVRAARAGRPQVRQVVLPPVPRRAGEAGYEETAYTDLEWDPASASVESSGHSCAGACGERSRWVFDGRDFVLASHVFYTPGGAELLEAYRTELRPRR